MAAKAIPEKAKSHIPSRNEKNAQKLKQNEFFASHARMKMLM
jgi:hypothetical protein